MDIAALNTTDTVAVSPAAQAEASAAAQAQAAVQAQASGEGDAGRVTSVSQGTRRLVDIFA